MACHLVYARRVGHVTLRSGDSVRTGVTAILPHDGSIFRRKVPAAVYAGNGFGKLIGSTQIDELGVIESPIVLTNTLSVWRAAEALADYALGCTLVYALVPNKPLETIVRDRACILLRRRRAPVEHSMLLEGQAVSAQDSEARLDEFVRETNPSRLWDEP